MPTSHSFSVNKKLFGFTLIELLVVIAIIAILAAVGFVTYSSVQKGARDSKRRAEVDSISKALEIRYQIASGATCDGGGSPNGGTYCPLQNSWFANNVVPTDTTYGYCIWYNATLTSPSLASVTPAAWAAGSCPDIALNSKSVVGPNVPAVNASAFFKVCSVMEKDGTVYCVNSKQ